MILWIKSLALIGSAHYEIKTLPQKLFEMLPQQYGKSKRANSLPNCSPIKTQLIQDFKIKFITTIDFFKVINVSNWTTLFSFENRARELFLNRGNRIFFKSSPLTDYFLWQEIRELCDIAFSGSHGMTQVELLPSNKIWILIKQACCAGCTRRPFPMQLHKWEKSTPSVKWP